MSTVLNAFLIYGFILILYVSVACGHWNRDRDWTSWKTGKEPCGMQRNVFMFLLYCPVVSKGTAHTAFILYLVDKTKSCLA
jgi:hypothetical protein